jgi:hypothetical protein
MISENGCPLRWEIIHESSAGCGVLLFTVQYRADRFLRQLAPVLIFLLSPSFSAISMLPFLFSPFDCSLAASLAASRLPNPNDLPSAGVGMMRGLGNTAELRPFLPESYHSLKKLLGLGNRSLFMYLLGSADMGVSMLFLLSL